MAKIPRGAPSYGPRFDFSQQAEAEYEQTHAERLNAEWLHLDELRLQSDELFRLWDDRSLEEE